MSRRIVAAIAAPLIAASLGAAPMAIGDLAPAHAPAHVSAADPQLMFYD